MISKCGSCVCEFKLSMYFLFLINNEYQGIIEIHVFKRGYRALTTLERRKQRTCAIEPLTMLALCI